MDCPVCAREITAQDAFCRHCGARMRQEDTPPRSAAVDDMVAEYRNALADKPNDPAGLYNVGLGCLYCRNYGAAADAFRSVIELLPDDPAAYEKLAVCLARLGRGEEALELARKAHELAPGNPSAIRLLKALGG